MATSREMQARIEAFARQLAEEFGDEALGSGTCWLDSLENHAVEVGDAVSRAITERQAELRPAEEQAACPDCGEAGRFEGHRKRELLGRRGPIEIQEPEYHCPGCRRDFFPDDAGDRR